MKGFDIAELLRLSARPRLFSETGNEFWTDPYIAEHILYAHLDPTESDASRPRDEILRSVAWMSATIRRLVIPGSPSPRLLDLGCGPGLYAIEFARLGFDVHGIDFSPVAIEYARKRAEKEKRSISYECADMRTLMSTGEYDAATMIFGGFGVLSNRDRTAMLRKIARALVPGGLFLFDVFRRSYVERTAIDERWYTAAHGGFWMGTPHLVLERSFEYPERQVNLNRYIIMTGAGEFRAYNVWRHWYDEPSVRKEIEKAGFETLGIFGDLCGSQADDEWIAVVARKRR